MSKNSKKHLIGLRIDMKIFEKEEKSFIMIRAGRMN